MPIDIIPVKSNLVKQFLSNCVEVDFSRNGDINREDVKSLYPGLEDIVDLLLDNGIPFSMDGDVDLLDHNDMVIATAGLLLRKSKIAIDPVDDDSVVKFKAAGYRVVDSTSFNLSMIKQQ